jgi:hypothetical protein
MANNPAVSVDNLTSVVLELRDAVSDAQRAELCLPFPGKERRTWFYWPAARRGLALGALDGAGRKRVDAVLTAMMTTPALAKVMTIIGLEVVLADLEGEGALRRRRSDGLPRDPSAYNTTIFGNPANDAAWGVRFEGHHVSLHTTVVDGQVAPTPIFLGANPARVEHHGRIVLRPLAEEEDIARALLAALPDAARRRAVIDDTAPSDIVTTNAPQVDHDLSGGVALADLRGEAAALAAVLVALHADRSRVAPGRTDHDDLHFAWAGDHEIGRPHYYRIHGARFLVEYDNTQNDANHAHSVWRDPEGDFGEDLLRTHHAAHHHDR